MQDGVPFSRFFLRGMPGGAGHDGRLAQTHELMDMAAKSVRESAARGRRSARIQPADQRPKADRKQQLGQHVVADLETVARCWGKNATKAVARGSAQTGQRRCNGQWHM